MSGINDFGDSIPSILPGTELGEQIPQTPTTPPPSSIVDQDTIQEQTEPNFLKLGTGGTLPIPPGQVSLIELSKLISQVVQELKENLTEAEILDAEISRNFRLESANTANTLIARFLAIVGLVDAWTGPLAEAGTQVIGSYAQLDTARDQFNNLLMGTLSQDANAIHDVNTLIDIYNNPLSFQIYVNTQHGGDVQAAMAAINAGLQAYNQYVEGRPELQQGLDEYRNAILAHNELINETNEQIENVNLQRAQLGLGLDPLPLLSETFVPGQDITQYLAYEGELTANMPVLSLPPGSTPVDRVDPPSGNDLMFVEPLIFPGEMPRVPISNAIITLWLPEALPTLAFLSSFSRILDLAGAYRETESLFNQGLGFNIITPSAYIERTNELYLDAIGLLGGGIGLASFSLGLHAQNLEITLSRAILQSLAMNSSFPITGRLFARLQFTALQLLQNSALLSPLPALRYIASAMGLLTASSPAARVALSLAISSQVIGAIATGDMRAVINQQLNGLPFFARMEFERSLKGVELAEQNLQYAIESGNPYEIRRTLKALGQERMRLARTTRLFNTFGLTSIGGMAAFTNAVSATMSLSILAVALAHFGRSIGMPQLVAQVFGHVSGISSSDILLALTGAPRLADVLDNPIAALALKNHLVNLVGAGNEIAINNAVNNIILHRGISGGGHLRASLIDEFQSAGFSHFQAVSLANETVALIRGDMGINFLSVAFGLNFDSAFVATAVANHILGIEGGIAGAMLSNANTRSLMLGGFGSHGRLQNELTDRFTNLGLNPTEAEGLAKTYADFIATASLAIPLSLYPGLISQLLGDTLLQAVASGSALSREDLISDFSSRGMGGSQAGFLADQVLSLAAGTFTTPGDLFAIVLDNALTRSGTSFETQRELRDQLLNELKGVGFGTRDAVFIANMLAAYALDGTLLSPLERGSAIDGALVNSLSSGLGISETRATAIMQEAKELALKDGPFSTETQYRWALEDAISSVVKQETGREDGGQILRRAFNELAEPGTVLNLAGLTEQISSTVLGLLRPDMGSRLAQEMKDQILMGLLGGTTVDEIENEEQRNPLSVLSQIEDALNELKKTEEEEDIEKNTQKLIQLLQGLLTPNAEVGFLLQSISDSPSTFIGSVLGAQQPKGEFLQIPA